MQPDTYPILEYFAYEHLPEFLQRTSKPYAEVAKILSECAEDDPMVDVLLDGLRHTLEDREGDRENKAQRDEIRAAVIKLRRAREAMKEHRSVPLRLLLEAKDCAVRAMVPQRT